MRRFAQLYGPKVTALAIALAACSVLLLIVMMRSLIGPFDVLPNEKAIKLGRLGLWEAPSVAGDPEWAKAKRWDRWRALVPSAIEIHTSSDLQSLGEWASVVAVADASRLTGAESAQLVEFVERGGSALLVGWIGTAGDGSSTALMERLLRVRRVAALPRDASHFVAAGARGPLNSGLLPGQRADLVAQGPSPALEDPRSELYWSTWSLRPQPQASGAALRMERGEGRLVWLAIDPERAAAPEALSILGRVYANAFAWAARAPVVELLPWPGGAPLAGILAMDTEDDFANAGPVARRARTDGFPVTFLVVSGMAVRYPAIVEALATAGEIGSHAEVHDGFKDLEAGDQRARLERTRAHLRRLGIDKVGGFRPPYESYDEATLRALVQTGFDYILGDLDLRGMAPRVVRPDASGSTLVQIPRAIQDDYDLIVKREIADAASLRREFSLDLERSEALGGLHYFSFHTQYFGPAERLEALAWLAAELRSRGAWLATGRELASWWLQRAQIDHRVTQAGPRRLQIHLTNRASTPARDLVLRVHANDSISSAEVSGTNLFQKVPAVRLDEGRVDLLLPELPPRVSRTYVLDLESDLGLVARRGAR